MRLPTEIRAKAAEPTRRRGLEVGFVLRRARHIDRGVRPASEAIDARDPDGHRHAVRVGVESLVVVRGENRRHVGIRRADHEETAHHARPAARDIHHGGSAVIDEFALATLREACGRFGRSLVRALGIQRLVGRAGRPRSLRRGVNPYVGGRGLGVRAGASGEGRRACRRHRRLPHASTVAPRLARGASPSTSSHATADGTRLSRPAPGRRARRHR